MLCNILTVILRPNFEEPLDTAKQLVEKNITIYIQAGLEDNKQWLLESPIPEYRILGENAIVSDDLDHFENMTAHDVMGAGTHALRTFFVDIKDMKLGEEYHPQGRGWYRSKETLAGINPYYGYLTSKKWHLNEVLSKIKYS